MERSLIEKPDADVMIQNARDKWSDFLKKPIVPAIDEDGCKQIDRWEQRAVKLLSEQ